MELAEVLLQKFQGNIQEVRLCETPLHALDLIGVEKRHQATMEKDFFSPLFDAAKRFADSDIIVIAASYGDLMFPSVLKTYFDNITVFCADLEKIICKAKMEIISDRREQTAQQIICNPINIIEN